MSTTWAAAAAKSIVKFATVIATIIINTIAPMGAIAKGLGAKRYSPTPFPDSYQPSHRRRCAKHGTRAVERVVIDQWLMWRH